MSVLALTIWISQLNNQINKLDINYRSEYDEY